MRLYVGNKMVGRPYYNFPWFDEVSAELIKVPGVDSVFNPAERDRAAGFDPVKLAEQARDRYEKVRVRLLSEGSDGILHTYGFSRREALHADWAWIAENSDGMAVGPDWLDSTGTVSEVAAHQALGLPVWRVDDFLKYGTAAPTILRLAPTDETVIEQKAGVIRQFTTGATRDEEDRKHDLEGFLSPLALRAFGAYMHKHRKQKNGALRASDNWQKGIPRSAYMKSGMRHFMDWWTLHRGFDVKDFDGDPVELVDALCGVIFNAQGYLHQLLKDQLDQATSKEAA